MTFLKLTARHLAKTQTNMDNEANNHIKKEVHYVQPTVELFVIR